MGLGTAVSCEPLNALRCRRPAGRLGGHAPNSAGGLQAPHWRSRELALRIRTVCLTAGCRLGKLYLFSESPDTSTFGENRTLETLVTGEEPRKDGPVF